MNLHFPEKSLGKHSDTITDTRQQLVDLQSTSKLTDDSRDDDYPSVAVLDDTTAWAVGQSYSGQPGGGRHSLHNERHANRKAYGAEIQTIVKVKLQEGNTIDEIETAVSLMSTKGDGILKPLIEFK